MAVAFAARLHDFTIERGHCPIDADIEQIELRPARAVVDVCTVTVNPRTPAAFETLLSANCAAVRERLENVIRDLSAP